MKKLLHKLTQKLAKVRDDLKALKAVHLVKGTGRKALVALRHRLGSVIESLVARVKKLRAKIRHQHQGGPSVMYDAVTVSNIPTSAPAVGAYVGPSIVTVDAVKRQCPKARIVRISQAGMTSTPADVVDVEPGDATNDTGAKWLRRKLDGEALGGDAGKVPKVYTSASNVNAFVAYAKSKGIDRSKYRVWSAHYGRGEHVCGPNTCGYPQADGTQWTDTALGRSLDQSKLNPSFWD